MKLLTFIIGRLGLTINPQTGQRVRIRYALTGDHCESYYAIEEWSPSSNSWERKNLVR